MVMKKYGFLGGPEAIKSLRSSGYRNTSMAIGELIDNSIQAHATELTIVLICSKREGIHSTRKVDSIAVIDNGTGMTPEILQTSLILGEGTNRNEKEGMGKYGVGLPQASISQSKRVDVWSWMNESTLKHVYIDLSNNDWLNDAEIKTPDDEHLPECYKKYINKKSGTIVEWSNLDRVSWKKPETIFNKCENQIGRMYRYWLTNDKIKIGMICIDAKGNEIGEIRYFKPVDPLFLMEDGKCGNPPEKPMFKSFTEGCPLVKKYSIPTDDGPKEVEVRFKFSIVKDNVRNNDDDEADNVVAGRKDFGKLASDCIGVSIVRENRELELSDRWKISYDKDPRHRWWGAEISFNRDLDDIFGVTNNKQSATKIDDYAKKSYNEIMDNLDIKLDSDRDRNLALIKQNMPEEYILIDTVLTVQTYISNMLKAINLARKTFKTNKSQRYNTSSKALDLYDRAADIRSKNKSTQSETDLLIQERGDKRVEGVQSELDKTPNYSDEDKEQIIEDVKKGHRNSLLSYPTGSTAFFNVERKDTHMVVIINNDHPMYDKVFGPFTSMLDGRDHHDDESLMKTSDAFETLKFIFSSWARMEDEDFDPEMKREYRRIREKWGGILEDSNRAPGHL